MKDELGTLAELYEARLTARRYSVLQHIRQQTYKHVHTVMHTWWTHAHTQAHVCEKNKATESKRSRNLFHLHDWISDEAHQAERCPYLYV